jgi:predicted AAA+ superfamily ATPase
MIPIALNPVVVLTDARQVGKSTLLLNAEPFCNWRFYTMDDLDVLRQASQNPEALWAGVDRVVLDEVQRAPNLLSAVKKTIDQNLGRYRFILDRSSGAYCTYSTYATDKNRSNIPQMSNSTYSIPPHIRFRRTDLKLKSSGI